MCIKQPLSPVQEGAQTCKRMENYGCNSSLPPLCASRCAGVHVHGGRKATESFCLLMIVFRCGFCLATQPQSEALAGKVSRGRHPDRGWMKLEDGTLPPGIVLGKLWAFTALFSVRGKAAPRVPGQRDGLGYLSWQLYAFV